MKIKKPLPRGMCRRPRDTVVRKAKKHSQRSSHRRETTPRSKQNGYRGKRNHHSTRGWR